MDCSASFFLLISCKEICISNSLIFCTLLLISITYLLYLASLSLMACSSLLLFSEYLTICFSYPLLTSSMSSCTFVLKTLISRFLARSMSLHWFFNRMIYYSLLSICCRSKLRTLVIPLTIVINSNTLASLIRLASSSTIDYTSCLILFSNSFDDWKAPNFISCWISCSICKSRPKFTSDAILFEL